MNQQRRLEGKRAAVTGASRGIGRAIACRLAQEGASLVLNHRNNDTAMQEVVNRCGELGDREPIVVKGDIADKQTITEIVACAKTNLGGMDLLVNNAGVSAEDLLLTQADDDVMAMVSTNILGMVQLTRAALRPMLRQRCGCVVNLSSILARRPGRGNAVYAGTKGFVESFTRALAVEVGHKGIRVNAVAPGVVETDMSQQVRALAGESMRQRVALGRFGTPDEVASLVAYVASDEAGYLNGAVIPLDGALRCW